MNSVHKTALALSGGVDSTTVLQWLLDRGDSVVCVQFQYQSKHNIFEVAAAQQVYQFYARKSNLSSLSCIQVDLSGIFTYMKSNLLKGQGEIPEGHYADETMKQTVVPARNMIFLSVMAGLAESYGCNSIALGIHQGDHAIYPDCRPEFYNAMQHAVELGTGGKVAVEAPFLHATKSEIVKYGLTYGVPYHLTRTCYKEQELSCGKCGSCIERVEAFALNDCHDPIPYEDERR